MPFMPTTLPYHSAGEQVGPDSGLPFWFRDLLENASDLVQSVAPDGRILYANRAWRETLGYAEEEIASLRLPDIIHPDCAEFCQTCFSRLLAGEELGRVEAKFLTRDGRGILVEGSVSCYLENGRPVATRGIFRDITERKKAEEVLRRSEERFRLLYEDAPVSYQSLDGEGRFLEVNKAFTETFGYSREEVVGQWIGDFLPPASRSRLKKQFADLKTTGKIRGVEFPILRKDGTLLTVQVDGCISCDAEGHFQQTHCILHNVTERKKAEARIEQLAYFDQLTRLPNRTTLQERLHQAIAQAGRDDRQVAVLFLDLDDFKGVNDSLGHSSGDRLLQVVAERLTGCVRRGDTVARLGGDEFVILLTGIREAQDVSAKIQEILRAVSAPVRLGGREVSTTVSIGLAVFPLDGADPETLLKNADSAMYRAKAGGRNTYRFFTADMNARSLERLLLRNDLHHALEQQEFSLVYQPQIEVPSGRIVALEALLRWTHPDLGTVSPGLFLPLAEETGTILPLGHWVLQSAMRQGREWLEAGLPPVRISVNLSGRQFRNQNLVETVRNLIRETGFDPHLLELEMTENILMEDAETTGQSLTRLKEMGVHLAIDDFGTGYSSLNYLRLFPVDRLKIDNSFVQEIGTDKEKIVAAIAALAATLGLEVVAEGVENARQAEFLLAHGCRTMQGFRFCRPQPAAAVPSLFRPAGS